MRGRSGWRLTVAASPRSMPASDGSRISSPPARVWSSNYGRDAPSAAELWAQVRQRGLPTADPAALDEDVTLAAQAQTMEVGDGEVVVATTNIGHLSRLIAARLWQEIP